MYTVISPAKRLHEGPAIPSRGHTTPQWLDESTALIERLQPLSEESLSQLMGISASLASLNSQRYQDWGGLVEKQAGKQAALTFAGDTYVGLDAASLDASEMDFAQDHLGILSGLHGLLRPLDLIQPYRLEMGTSLKNARGKNLYEFWGSRIAERIAQSLEAHPHKALINLASTEYFKALDREAFPHRVVTPVFKEIKGGKAKVVSFVAKRARGTMARYIVRNRVEDPERLKGFTEMGYAYQADASSEDAWVFTRPSGTPS